MNHNQLYIDPLLLQKEVKYKMSSSSGNGGQNVNRLATKAALYFSIQDSKLFNEDQKLILLEKLKHRISNDGFLIVVNQESRSAETNKQTAFKNFIDLLYKAFVVQKVRKKIKRSRSLNEKRLTSKKRNSEKKELRKKVF